MSYFRDYTAFLTAPPLPLHGLFTIDVSPASGILYKSPCFVSFSIHSHSWPLECLLLFFSLHYFIPFLEFHTRAPISSHDGSGSVESTWIVHVHPRSFGSQSYIYDGAQSPVRAGVLQLQNAMTVQTVHFMVPLCCDKCEKKVKEQLVDLDDVERVTCDQWKQQVTVTSAIAPEKLLKRLQKIKKRSAFWPQPH